MWLQSIKAYKNVVYVFLELKSSFDIMESDKFKSVSGKDKQNIFNTKYSTLRPFIRKNLNASLLTMISEAINLYGDIYKDIQIKAVFYFNNGYYNIKNYLNKQVVSRVEWQKSKLAF